MHPDDFQLKVLQSVFKLSRQTFFLKRSSLPARDVYSPNKIYLCTPHPDLIVTMFFLNEP